MLQGNAGRRLLPNVNVRATRIEDVDALRSGLEDWLALRYGNRWGKRVELGTMERRLEQATQGVRIFKWFMGAIAAISLLVGGIGIMNVMLASVTERTREIGVRKALGARRRDVLLQFLSESVAISSVGSALGIVLGSLIASGAFVLIRQQTGADGLSRDALNFVGRGGGRFGRGDRVDLRDVSGATRGTALTDRRDPSRVAAAATPAGLGGSPSAPSRGRAGGQGAMGPNRRMRIASMRRTGGSVPGMKYSV